MKRLILLMIAVIASIDFATLAAEAEQVEPTAQIEPFVNEYTLGVIRLDLSGIDFDALDRWADQAIARDDRQAITQEFGTTPQEVREWVKKFDKAGGEAIWLVFTVEPVPQHSPVFMVVPTHAGADVTSLKKLFARAAPRGPDRPELLEAHDALVIGSDTGAVEWLKKLRPAPRPQLATALAPAGKGKLQFALIPSEDARKVVESMAPTLPDGQSASALARGIEWGAAEVQLPPDVSVHAVVQSHDQKAVQELKKALKSLSSLIRQPPGGADNQVMKRLINAAADLASGTQVRGDQLVIELDSEQGNALAAGVIGGLWSAHEQAQRLRSADNIAQILKGCIMYANNRVKDNQFPDTFEQLLKDQDMTPAVLINPRNPNEKVGYVYVKPPDGTNAPNDRMIIYEKFDSFDGGINAGFADGHVEWIDSQKQFEELFKAAKNAKPNPLQK